MQPNDSPIHPDELGLRWPKILERAIREADDNIALRERTDTDASIPRDARKLMIALGGLVETHVISIDEAVERLDLLLRCVRDDDSEEV